MLLLNPMDSDLAEWANLTHMLQHSNLQLPIFPQCLSN